MTLDPLPISLVAHTVFCPRRAWLEAAGEQVESVAIEAGVAAHKRIDARSDDRVSRRRSVDVSHKELGLTGRCDVVDLSDGVEIVEYKSAPLRRSTTVTDAQRVQLHLQRLALEGAGVRADKASVYFTTSRRAIPVELTQEGEEEAKRYVQLTRDVVSSQTAPEPLVEDPRCRWCSHVSVCLPDEHLLKSSKARRIAVAAPHASVVHLTVSGSRAYLRAGRMQVVKGKEQLATFPFQRVQAVVVHGNVDLSSALIRELCWHRRPVIWCSYRGRVVGVAHQASRPNGAARSRLGYLDEDLALAVARPMIASKIANQGTFLRRNAKSEISGERQRLRELSRLAAGVPTRAQLLGVEGEAAALYFRSFPALIAGIGREFVDGWRGREGRGASDGLNVALNLAYGLLTADAVRALLAAGLDPHSGLLHSSSRNKPALALDLMEEFRPLVADSVIVGAINNGELKPTMFCRALGDVRLRDTGRRAIITCYERRLASEFGQAPGSGVAPACSF